MSEDKITLMVRGRRLETWKSATVTAGIDQAARAFSVMVSDAQADFLANDAVQEGDDVTVAVAGVPVLVGYAEKIGESESKTGHDITVQGRSKTCDLIDSSEDAAPGQWRNMTLSEVANAIAAPYGVAVEIDGPEETIPVFDTDVGETCFDALEELSRMFGLMVCDTAGGHLRLARAGFERASGALEGRVERAGRRGNILDWSFETDGSQRFSHYIVRGQQQSSARIQGTDSAEPQGLATDAGVKRYRPKIVTAEAGGGPTYCQQRAEWEMAQANALAMSFTVTVTGWRQAGGALWRPGLLVPVKIERYGVKKVDGDFVIAALSWSIDSGGGRVTRLTLRDPAGYDLQPEAPPRQTAAATGGASSSGGASPYAAYAQAVGG